MTYINMMYKRKDKKVLSANVLLPNDINPDSGVNHANNLESSSGKSIPRGSGLTSECCANMKIGVNFLSEADKQLFVDILFECEGGIAFDDSEMSLPHPEIESSVVIHMVHHSP